MSAVIRGNVRMALANIRRSKVRSGFTMFGVIIAVLPVLTIVGIGEGVTRQIEKQIDQLGSTILTVRPGSLESGDALQQLGALGGLGTGSTLSQKDVEALEKLEVLDGVAPISVASGSVTATDVTLDNALVLGTNDALPTVLHKQVRYGEFFGEQDAGRNLAVVGREVAEALFNESAPLGRSFVWRGETFMVRGVLEQFTAAPLSLTTDFNNAILLPIKTVATITDNAASITTILTQPAEGVSVSEAQAATRQALQDARGGARDVSVLTQTDNLRITNEVLNLLTLLVATVAGIALFVAGIGIMNIMLVSVTERMHEIGVRKAIGATRQQIMDQFMAEAAVLTLIGSIIGVILAFIGQYFIGLLSPIQPFITWQAVLVVVGISLFVGLLFGTIPASKAARKDPIQALRGE